MNVLLLLLQLLLLLTQALVTCAQDGKHSIVQLSSCSAKIDGKLLDLSPLDAIRAGKGAATFVNFTKAGDAIVYALSLNFCTGMKCGESSDDSAVCGVPIHYVSHDRIFINSFASQSEARFHFPSNWTHPQLRFKEAREDFRIALICNPNEEARITAPPGDRKHLRMTLHVYTKYACLHEPKPHSASWTIASTIVLAVCMLLACLVIAMVLTNKFYGQREGWDLLWPITSINYRRCVCCRSADEQTEPLLDPTSGEKC